VPITLYCDEHFGPDVTNDFMVQGRAILLGAELARVHLPKALDFEHMLFAAERGWIILTRDADYQTLQTWWRVIEHWRPTLPRRHHAGIIWISSGQIKDRQVVPHVVQFLASGYALQDELYSLKLNAGTTRWHGFRPLSRYLEPPL
jgi:hypothetical protein